MAKKVMNLIGKRFGKLVVLEFSRMDSNNNSMWLCQCDCGTQTIVRGYSLKCGETKSCGCLAVELRTKVFPGQKYGRLTVLKRRKDLESNVWTVYECLCDCGNLCCPQGSALISGNTRSCGCLHKDVIVALKTTHGKSRTPNYKKAKNKLRRDREYSAITANWDHYKERALKEFQPFCAICGELDKLHIDHVLPISKGYPLYPGNAVMLCQYHNYRKHDKDLDELPVEWKKKILFYSRLFERYWKEKFEW